MGRKRLGLAVKIGRRPFSFSAHCTFLPFVRDALLLEERAAPESILQQKDVTACSAQTPLVGPDSEAAQKQLPLVRP